MSIPLVQNNEKDSINTSIIAIKRNIERINMLLGLVDSGSPDLSGLATKQELEDAITQVETDLAPVDEVTSGNMQSVTSSAVAGSFEWEDLSDKVHFTIDVSGSTVTTFNVSLRQCFRCKNLLKFSFTITPTETIPEPSGNGNLRFYVQIDGVVPSSELTNITTISYLGKRIFPISWAYSSAISPNGWRVTVRYNESISTSNFSSYFITSI